MPSLSLFVCIFYSLTQVLKRIKVNDLHKIKILKATKKIFLFFIFGMNKSFIKDKLEFSFFLGCKGKIN